MGGKTLNHGSPMDSITFKNYQVNVTFVIQFALLHMPFHSRDQERSFQRQFSITSFTVTILYNLFQSRHHFLTGGENLSVRPENILLNILFKLKSNNKASSMRLGNYKL